NRAHRAAPMSNFISAPYLAGDLPLADDHGIQAGHDPKQMAHRVGIAMLVAVRRKVIFGELVKLPQESGNQPPVKRGQLIRPRQEKPPTVTRPKNDRPQAVTPAQPTQAPDKLPRSTSTLL